jgi:hypothetical protein
MVVLGVDSASLTVGIFIGFSEPTPLTDEISLNNILYLPFFRSEEKTLCFLFSRKSVMMHYPSLGGDGLLFNLSVKRRR